MVLVALESNRLARLVLSQFCWRGASPETIHSLIPRVQKILLVDLQFSCMEDVIDEVGDSRYTLSTAVRRPSRAR